KSNRTGAICNPWALTRVMMVLFSRGMGRAGLGWRTARWARNGPIFGGPFSLKIGGEGRGANGLRFPLSSPGLTGRSSTPRLIGSSAAVSGILDAPLEAGHDSGACGEHFPTHTSTFSRRKSVRAVDRNSPSSDERAQGMPGEGLTHGPRAVKKHGEGTTGS